LSGELSTPGDKSISHRALLLASLAEGTSRVRGLSDGADVAHTLAAVAALGADVALHDGVLSIQGGRARLSSPSDPIDCGNSGTAMRLLAGVLAGIVGTTELFGDASLSARPMDRVALPLRAMGAEVSGKGERCLPPIALGGGQLVGIEWTSLVPSAQVKSAILLAALGAVGETVVREEVATRAHTEEMLLERGVDIEVQPWGMGSEIRLHPGPVAPRDTVVPGDPSQSAFWVVAGCVVEGSDLLVDNVYDGPARLGFLDVLERMGAHIEREPGTDSGVRLHARNSPLAGTVIEAAEIPSLDEVPILAVATACATGKSVFRNVGELRVKEVDRLEATIALVRSFGASARADGDDLYIEGLGGSLRHGRFDSAGDHRMAMAAVVAALAAGEGESVLAGADAVETSYPGFFEDLSALAGPEVWRHQETDQEPAPGRDAAPGTEESRIVAIDGPAGSGKSTVSRAVAARLGVARLDTGAMYRSVAALALHEGIDPADAEALAELAANARIEVGEEGVWINDLEVTQVIRSPEVSRAVSVVAANPAVRSALVERQRAWARRHGGGVVEGRDIGSVVFPAARVKVYLTASPEERQRRRDDESPEGVARRDRIDSTRAASPLAVAKGAHVLDTTGHSVEDVVEEVLSWW
jgi:3-phosphoshikimate 1-carboxyvinyltransferase